MAGDQWPERRPRPRPLQQAQQHRCFDFRHCNIDPSLAAARPGLHMRLIGKRTSTSTSGRRAIIRIKLAAVLRSRAGVWSQDGLQVLLANSRSVSPS
jgi:hypothetical protein